MAKTAGIYFTLSGHKELTNALQEMGLGKKSLSILRSSTSASLVVYKKHVKNAIPPHMKELRRSVGQRIEKRNKLTKHKVEGKVGPGVGKKSNKARINETFRIVSRKGARPGVGISGRNAHWWLLGTGERTVEETNQKVGKMPHAGIPSPVTKGFDAGHDQAASAFRQRFAKRVVKELDKMKGKK